MQPNRVTYFAKTDARGREVPFGIKDEDRLRHSYVIGKTGMGKSTLLENMAVQDIQNGNGLTFIDPHGSTAEKLLEYVPEDRIKDVLYFAPFDLSYPISFNVMEDVDQDKRHLVVNGLMSTFEKIWIDAWSARMAYILQNTLLALLEYPGATLLAVNRMYTDKDFRSRVVERVTDPTVKAFWTEEFAKYTDRFAAEATPAIQNKIGQFSSNALVRNIIGQPQSAFDMRKVMDEKKIFIVNLSKGRVGEGNANLLGSMLITKIYLAAMSRADATAGEMGKLPPHYLYVDEFQSFANKSFADILSEARKYKLSLTIAHQYIEQMEEEVRAAVFGNVGTMITFRVGAYDAEILEKEFAPTFMLEDIVNLGARQIYLKLMIDGVSSQPFSATTLPPIELPRISHRDQAVASSRRMYAQPREEVEANIKKWHEPVESSNASSSKKKPNEKQGDQKSDRPRPPVEKPPERPPREKLASIVKSSAPSTATRDILSAGEDREQSPRSNREEQTGSSRTTEKPMEDLRSILAELSNKEAEKENRKEKAREAELEDRDVASKHEREFQSEEGPLRKNVENAERAGADDEMSERDQPKPKKKKKALPKEVLEAEEQGRNELKEALAALTKNNSQEESSGTSGTDDRSNETNRQKSDAPQSDEREPEFQSPLTTYRPTPDSDAHTIDRGRLPHVSRPAPRSTPRPNEIPESELRRMLDVPDDR